MKKVLVSLLFVAISGSLLFAGGAKDSSQSMKKDDGMMAKDNGSMMKNDDGAMMKKDDGAMMKKDDGMMAKDESMAMDSPFGSLKGLGSQVVGFTSEKDAQALAKTQTVVYFFAASWCPNCKATFKDISANFSIIPKTTTIVIVNYDKSADLKKKYGVAMQHTFVTIDSTGAKKKIWNGSLTVKEILSNSMMGMM